MITVDLCSILLFVSSSSLLLYTFFFFLSLSLILSAFRTFISLVYVCVCKDEDKKSYWSDFPKEKVKHIITSKWWYWKIARCSPFRWRVHHLCCYCCWCWILWTETKCTTLNAASKALNIFYMAALCSLLVVVSLRIFRTVSLLTGTLAENDHFHIQFSLCWIWFGIVNNEFESQVTQKWRFFRKEIPKRILVVFGIWTERRKQVAHIILKTKILVQ